MGTGPIGVLFMIFFELCSFLCLGLSSYKLYMWVTVRGWQANVSQVCLAVEIIVAICMSSRVKLTDL
jgi:hypothetical protein